MLDIEYIHEYIMKTSRRRRGLALIRLLSGTKLDKPRHSCGYLAQKRYRLDPHVLVLEREFLQRTIGHDTVVHEEQCFF